MVTGCALGTDVCHWMFKTKVNMVQGHEDAPLNNTNQTFGYNIWCVYSMFCTFSRFQSMNLMTRFTGT